MRFLKMVQMSRGQTATKHIPRNLNELRKRVSLEKGSDAESNKSQEQNITGSTITIDEATKMPAAAAVVTEMMEQKPNSTVQDDDTPQESEPKDSSSAGTPSPAHSEPHSASSSLQSTKESGEISQSDDNSIVDAASQSMPTSSFTSPIKAITPNQSKKEPIVMAPSPSMVKSPFPLSPSPSLPCTPKTEAFNLERLNQSSGRATPRRAEQMYGPNYGREQHRYAELKLDKYLRVNLCQFENPSQFYVNNERNQEARWDMYEKIDEFAATRHHELIGFDKSNVSKYYFAKFNVDDKYHRCRIEKYRGESDVVVRCLDTGAKTVVRNEDVYELPDDLLETEFQAIPCRMYGIQSHDGEWSEADMDRVYDELLKDFMLFVKALRVPSNAPRSAAATAFQCYTVVLVAYDYREMFNIGRELVPHFARYEYEDTEKFLVQLDMEECHELVPQRAISNEGNVEDEENVDDDENWDHLNEPYRAASSNGLDSAGNENDLLEYDSSDMEMVDEERFMKYLMGQQAVDLFVPRPNAGGRAITDGKCTNNNDKNNDGPSDSDGRKPKRRPAKAQLPAMSLSHLKYTTKTPKVEWNQTETVVNLIISAADLSKDDYGLDVTKSSLFLW